jgi:hypothetical protein
MHRAVGHHHPCAREREGEEKEKKKKRRESEPRRRAGVAIVHPSGVGWRRLSRGGPALVLSWETERKEKEEKNGERRERKEKEE